MSTTIKTIKRTVVKTENIDLDLVNFTNKESEKEKPQKKLTEKFHLPVLNLNNKEEWDSIPKSQRKLLTDEIAEKTCTQNCCGYEDLAAGCCQIDPENLEHVLGKVNKEDISRILKHFRKINPSIERSDIVIDKEEGMRIGNVFFGGHEAFKSENSYPMLRLQIYENRFICKFLNPKTKRCGIYEVRPEMCKNYYCVYLKKNFLIRTPNNPNTYKKIL
jgi:Fe-S-cluster containining protein